MKQEEKVAIVNYIMAVNFLVANLEIMIEDEDYNEDKLLKRVEIVDKFRQELEQTTGIKNSMMQEPIQ